MSEPLRCSECGSPLPGYWPKGLCSRCAFDAALEGPEAVDNPLSPDTGAAGTGPSRFGDYELLEEIGRGGMGIIYRARQIRLNRVVALKMILAGQFASKQEVLRFRSEAEAAATLQHPNIVRIHETGERGGHHYFSMDYVEGRTLAEIARDGPLPAQRAAGYARSIAGTIHYAHSQGVLHRDLKPSNVIIDASDQPRITDFGLAKRVSGDFGVTVTGQVLGSPNFMPPEQTSAKGGRVGPASDVYGIGAILYCLLTGRPPFHAETIEELLLLLRDTEPVALRLLNPSVPRDLETICLKCLEKEPTRRFPTAQALADELGRFLRDEPIQARSPGTVGRFWRWCRRRPAVAALSASVLLLLLVVTFGSSLAAWRVNRARSAEQAANRDLRRSVSLLELERAEDFFSAHDAAAGVAHLSAILRRDPSNSIAAHRLVSALLQRGWALPGGPPMRHKLHVQAVSFSPNARRMLTASRDKTAAVWDVATGKQLFSVRHADAVSSARYSPDGRRFVTAAGGVAQICDAETGAVPSMLRHSNSVHWAEFSPDGTLVLTACADHVARIWDAASGTLKRVLRGHSRPILVARFSPGGKMVTTGTDLGGVRLWNVESGELVHKLVGHRDLTAIETLEFSPDGQRLVSGGYDKTARLWDVVTGEPIGEPLAHRLRVWHTAFSPDGKLLLVTCEDATARLWDVQTMRPLGEPLRHESGVNFGAFSPDGQSVVTTSSDNTARVWDVQTQTPLCQPLRHIERVQHASFSPDGRRLVTASDDGVAQIWQLRTRLEPAMQMQHDTYTATVAVSPDGAVLLTAARDRTVRLWNLGTGQPLSEPMPQETFVASGDVAADGRRVAAAFADHTVRIWDCGGGKVTGGALISPQLVEGIPRHGKKIHSVRFGAHDSRLVTASADGTARVWDAIRGAPVTAPLVHRGEVWRAQFSRDGKMVLTASEDGTARLWDAQTGRLLTEPLTHIDHIKSAEFSPDDTRIVTGSTDNTACVWDARTGRKLLTLQHARTVEHAAFSPDGRRIATACLDRTAQIWDANTGQALTPALQHHAPVWRVHFSSSAHRVFTGASSARAWDSDTGRPLTECLNVSGPWSYPVFEPVGGRVIMGTMNGIIHVWNIPEALLPVPEWFPGFAEALAGIRLGERGVLERAKDDELSRVAREASAREPKDFYERVAFRVVTPPTRRE